MWTAAIAMFPSFLTLASQMIQVACGLNDYKLLFALMRVVWSLLQNPHIHIEPYVSYLPFVNLIL